VDGRNEWEFNFFQAVEQYENATLMLEGYGQVMLVPFCVSAFGCDEDCATQFKDAAANGYDNNPYHGPIHAAQVCHLARWLTKGMRIMEKQHPLESTAFMIAAFCHDIKHIGRNNAFCVQSEHVLALLYNNSSVLENYHSSQCLELLETSKVLKNLSLKDRALVRSHIIENILATDMAEHFETISKFRVRREAQDFSSSEEADRRFIARLCLKSGDLGHGCLPWEMHMEWAIRVTKEFYAQGDEEKMLALPVSALCDRKDVDGIGKSQHGFLNFVVGPLYQALSESQPQSEYEHPPDSPVFSSDREPFEESSKNAKPKKKATAARQSTTDGGLFSIEHCCIAFMLNNSQRWQEDQKSIDYCKQQLYQPEEDDDEDGFTDDCNEPVVYKSDLDGEIDTKAAQPKDLSRINSDAKSTATSRTASIQTSDNPIPSLMSPGTVGRFIFSVSHILRRC